MLERWNPEKHMALLSSWGKERGIFESAGTPDLYPKNGYVADGKAIGFMFVTDAPRIAYMDMFVASKDTTKPERRKMVSEIIARLTGDARKLGVRVLLGCTQNHSFQATLESCGFTSYGGGYHYLSKTITES